MNNNNFNIVVLISGQGTTLQAIIDEIDEHELDYTIQAVISNIPGVKGLERADNAGIPSFAIPRDKQGDRKDYDRQLQDKIDEYKPDLIVLAGFMHVLSDEFVKHYEGSIINIHPSLLPLYRGTNTYQCALEAEEKHHGTSVHFVTHELDGGPLIAQVSFPIKDNDTVETLRVRTQDIERLLYPTIIQWFAAEQVRWNNGKVEWLDKDLAHMAEAGFIQFVEDEI